MPKISVAGVAPRQVQGDKTKEKEKEKDTKESKEKDKEKDKEKEKEKEIKEVKEAKEIEKRADKVNIEKPRDIAMPQSPLASTGVIAADLPLRRAFIRPTERPDVTGGVRPPDGSGAR